MIKESRKAQAGIAITGIVTLLLIFSLPIIGHLQGYWSSTVSELIITGLSAIGTLTLAILTSITLIQNRRLVEEHRKDRQEPIQRAILNEIVLDAKEKISRNDRKIFLDEFDWVESEQGPEPQILLGADLEVLRRNRDPVAEEIFREKYPEIEEMMIEYDSKIFDLDTFAGELVAVIREPVNQYIQENNVVGSDGELLETNEVIIYMLNYLTYVEGDNPEWWKRHKEQMQEDIIDENYTMFSEFYGKQEDITNLGQELHQELTGIRKEIQPKYGIHID